MTNTSLIMRRTTHGLSPASCGRSKVGMRVRLRPRSAFWARNGFLQAVVVGLCKRNCRMPPGCVGASPCRNRSQNSFSRRDGGDCLCPPGAIQQMELFFNPDTSDCGIAPHGPVSDMLRRPVAVGPGRGVAPAPHRGDHPPEPPSGKAGRSDVAQAAFWFSRPGGFGRG